MQQGDLIGNLIFKDHFQNPIECLKLTEQTDFLRVGSMQGLFLSTRCLSRYWEIFRYAGLILIYLHFPRGRHNQELFTFWQ